MYFRHKGDALILYFSKSHPSSSKFNSQVHFLISNLCELSFVSEGNLLQSITSELYPKLHVLKEADPKLISIATDSLGSTFILIKFYIHDYNLKCGKLKIEDGGTKIKFVFLKFL